MVPTTNSLYKTGLRLLKGLFDTRFYPDIGGADKSLFRTSAKTKPQIPQLAVCMARKGV